MKISWIVLLVGSALLTVSRAQITVNDDQAIDVVRSVIKADRQEVITKALQLTPTESEKFWPLYQQYRTEMDKVGDGLVQLVQNYATFYPDVPQEAAAKMLKDLTRLEDQQTGTRATYLKKMAKVLPAAKTLRFAQVENRLDLALRVALAAKIPLVPVEGQMTPSTTTATAYAEGTPGGVVVETHQLTATVTGVDQANRHVHLLTPDGFRQTVKVGPEAVNFDQIRAGDKLKVLVTEELVVQMAMPGETPDTGRVTFVALAPKGAKPGGIVSQTTQVAATIAAIDQRKRTATLRFEDGSTHTCPVRSDVDLAQRKVGDKVMVRVAEAIALTVDKP